MTCSWHNGGHVGGKKNSDKVFDEKEFDYYFANLERCFAIALTTEMGVLSRENCEGKYSNIKPSDESYRFDSVMLDVLRQKFRCAVETDYFIESAPYGFLFTSRKTLETNE